jgi:hypothetical protein
MKHVAWTKRKSALTLTLCAIIAASTIIILQNTQTTQAALIVPHPGLVGWWRFDEGSGTMAGDSSGNGNNGTIYGATWVPGKYGQALSFDGVSSKVVSSELGFDSTVGTLECWVSKPNWQEATPTPYSSFRAILTDKRDGNNFLNLHYRGSALVWEYQSGGSDVAVIVASTAIWPANSWHHVAAIYQANNFQLYVDGVLVGSDTSGATYTLGGTLAIGYGYIGGTLQKIWDGVIDEVHVYNRALSASEIQADFQQGPDFSSNLLIKMPKGTTQVITTLSWQGTGSINDTITTPTQSYTEDNMAVYQKTTYSTTSGTLNMLNIKRLSISVSALSADQNWQIALAYDNVGNYQISVETQK